MAITYAHVWFSSWPVRTLKWGTNGSPIIAMVGHRWPGSGKCLASSDWISQPINRGRGPHQTLSISPQDRGCPGLAPRPLFSLLDKNSNIFPFTSSICLGATTPSPAGHWEFHLCSQMWIPGSDGASSSKKCDITLLWCARGSGHLPETCWHLGSPGCSPDLWPHRTPLPP